MEKEVQSNSAKQQQIHEILFNREIGWQEIIYDLINTEQLDPWDVNITILTNKYLEKVAQLEEADFFVSGKVLLAASLLLRIKSEVLLNQYIKSIDEILFGKKEEISKGFERIELDESIPELIPKSPMPRMKKVTLNELMEALNKAIITENRRIKKEIVKKNALRETSISLPTKGPGIKDKIKELYSRLIGHLDKDQERKRVSFSDFVGTSREERIISFFPLLSLDHQKKVWLEQENPFDEFYIWLRKTYFIHNPDPFKDLKHELEEELKELDSEKRKRIEKVNKDFENPIGELFD